MRLGRVARLALLLALAAGASGFHPASAARAAIGTPVPNSEMPLLEGGKAQLLKDVEANVLVFFRPNQERSLGALRELAQCQTGFVGKSVNWVAVVSGSAPAEAVRTAMSESRLAVPVLLDQGDALYGSLGLALHPVVVIVGRDGKLAAFEPFRSIDFCTVVGARIRHVLREIDDAQLSAVLEPPKSTQGGNGQVARRYRAYAETLFRNQQNDKALENVKKSLERDPQLAASHALHGQILAALGNCAEANPAFERALALEAGNATAKEGLERCKAGK